MWHLFGHIGANSHITSTALSEIDIFQDYTPFCFIREPRERFISVYNHNRRIGKEAANILHTLSLRDVIDTIENCQGWDMDNNGQWHKDNQKISGHFKPQTYWITEKTETYQGAPDLKQGLTSFLEKHHIQLRKLMLDGSPVEHNSANSTTRPPITSAVADALRRQGVRWLKPPQQATVKDLQKILSTDTRLRNKFFDWYGDDFDLYHKVSHG